MTYQKQTWQNRIVDPVSGAVIQEGTRITETRMNHIEEGIFDAHTLAESIVGEVNNGFVLTSGGSMGLGFTASGLTASWTTGIGFVKGVRLDVSVGSIPLHPTQGQYLYLDSDGAVKITTSSSVADAKCPLWYFATDASKVLTSTDRRRSIGIAKQSDLKAHLDDKSNPHGVTTAQIGAETPAAAQAKVDAHANKATGAHTASAISIADVGGNFAATDVEGALNELNATATAAQTGAIAKGINNTSVSTYTALLQPIDTRSTAMTYTGGLLTKVEVKDGSLVVKTTELSYTTGKLSSVKETAGGKTITKTLSYNPDGTLAGVTKAVS
ncbi:hypothetical protein [Tumebacillus lipolyticus]|uniref:Uncharacterized protein n=1 Tax=Tumebacillus lipolyticus TaxID=1280370 RepID=A0ABW5A394_9BACL